MKNFYKYVILVCLITASCGSGDRGDPFEGVDLYGASLPSTLAAYNNLKTGTGKQTTGLPAMYVDFSAGMYTAFGTPAIKDLMPECFNTVLAQKFEVYKLAEGQVTPLQVSGSTELGQIVNDPKQYLDRRAPIQAAVEKIVGSQNDALLITDFEEWQNNAEVTATAYLKIPFSKWLKEGNAISFFIADYREGKVDKHIYFTVFTYGRATGKSLIDKLRSKLAVLPAKFDLAADAWALSTDYPGQNTGGIFHDAGGKSEKDQNVLDLQNAYINGLQQHKPFEYYPLGVSWATIAELRKDYVAQNQFNELFRKLFIDLSNDDSYRYKELEVGAFDATADFERYARSVEVLKHRPKIIKGSNGENKFSDEEKDPIALTCYTADGSVKPAYRYEAAESPVLTDMFLLNKALFTNTSATDKKRAEIGIAFSPSFDAGKITDPKGLLKITVKVKDATVNDANPVLDKLKWTNVDGVSNTGLYNSVKSTLDELKPAGKTIYTYYLKTTCLMISFPLSVISFSCTISFSPSC
jgi:hypothetical protein